MGSLLDRRLLFVTGKGGVGKTTVSAALALLAAERGKRTLICEMDGKGALAAAFDLAPLGFEPTDVRPNVKAMVMNTEDSLREYLRLFVRIPFVGRIGPLARMFDFVADAAPGVKEILAVGKLCYEVRERHYDLVVVDAEASGHIVSQIGAPQAIRELVQVGLVRDQTEWMIDILGDEAVTGLIAVTTPEEMPISETLELLTQVDERTAVHAAAVITNRVLPPVFVGNQLDLVQRMSNDPAWSVVAERAGQAAATVLDAATLAHERHRIGVEHLHSLQAGLPPGVPTLAVPELFTKATGRRVVTLVAEALDEEGI